MIVDSIYEVGSKVQDYDVVSFSIKPTTAAFHFVCVAVHSKAFGRIRKKRGVVRILVG
jgi:hypothetical protein